MTNKKLFLAIGGLVILTLIVFGPVLNLFRQRVATAKDLETELSKLETKIKALEGLDGNLATERVKKMEEVFPSNKPVVQLIGSLSQLAAQNNLTFGGLNLRPGSLSEEAESKAKVKKGVNPDLKDLQFGFQVGGIFGDISQFLAELENVSPLMKIDKVGLTIKTNPVFAEAETLVVASINVSSYYQAPPQTLGNVGTPVKLLSREDEALLNRLFSFQVFPVALPVAPTGKLDLFQAGL